MCGRARGFLGWVLGMDPQSPGTLGAEATPRALYPLPICVHPEMLHPEGDSEMLLRVQQLVKNLNSLTCKMDALKSNGKSCVGHAWSQFLPTSPGQHLSHSPNPGPLGSQNTACCPANWLEHEGHCYWFSSLRKPWPEAEKDCQLKNAQLVVINSRDEQVSPSSSGPRTGLIGITWGVLITTAI